MKFILREVGLHVSVSNFSGVAVFLFSLGDFAGKPQRVNGKVHGRVFVGRSPSPVEFAHIDLHSYIVANEGRAYVAISDLPETVGPSLEPLVSISGVIGWAFALEHPGFKNGFSIIGE